jgi:tellurite resistance protein
VTTRILPLNLFAVPLGLSGLGGAWSAAASSLDAPAWPSGLLFAVAALAWLVFSALYILSGIRRGGTFGIDLRHPVSGPFAAYIPVIGILLAAHYGSVIPAAAPWLVGIFVGALAVVAAQLISHWISEGLPQDALHPGYFLPVVAGSFIASIGLSSIGAHPAAIAAFGVGIFFWLVIGTIVTGRLITGARYPLPLVPTMAVLLAPPATGGVAWFLLSGGLPNAIQDALAGVLLIMLLVQLMLIRQYVKVPFSLTYWTFTFPIAASCNYIVRWMAVLRFPGWQAIAWSALALGTAVILVIAVRSIVFALRREAPGLSLVVDDDAPSAVA